MSLFQKYHLHDLLEQHLKQALNDVEGLSFQELSNPALAGRIEQIWASRRPAIPVVQRGDKYGERREVVHRTNEYGRDVSQTATVVDVRVPFRGNGEMFDYRPSTCSVLNEPVQLSGGTLIYTMPFDPAQEPRLEKLLDQIEQNLETMRQEEQAFGRQAVKMLSDAAENRRKKLEGDHKTAGNFSFKVT